MKPTLVALLAALGISRLDNEDVALSEGLASAKALRTDAEEKAEAAVEEADKAKTDADAEAEKLKTAQDALETEKADKAKLQTEFDAMKGKLDEFMAKETGRKDAADLAELVALAEKVNVDHKDVELPALRLAIAKTRVDSVDDKSEAGFVEGVLETIRKDAAPRDNRYDGLHAPPAIDPARTDGKPAGDPWLTNNRADQEG